MAAISTGTGAALPPPPPPPPVATTSRATNTTPTPDAPPPPLPPVVYAMTESYRGCGCCDGPSAPELFATVAAARAAAYAGLRASYALMGLDDLPVAHGLSLLDYVYEGRFLDPRAPQGGGGTAADKQERLRTAVAALEAGAPRAENAFELASHGELVEPVAAWEPDGTGELSYATEVCGCGDGGHYAWTVTKATVGGGGTPAAAEEQGVAEEGEDAS